MTERDLSAVSRPAAVLAVMKGARRPLSIEDVLLRLERGGRTGESKATVGTAISKLGTKGRVRRVSYARWVLVGSAADRNWDGDLSVLWPTRAILAVLDLAAEPLTTRQITDALAAAGRNEQVRQVHQMLQALVVRKQVQRVARGVWVRAGGPLDEAPVDVVRFGTLRDAVPVVLEQADRPLAVKEVQAMLREAGRPAERCGGTSIASCLHALNGKGVTRTVGFNRWILAVRVSGGAPRG